MPLTQTQLATALADRADLSKTDAKRALAALEEITLEQLGNAERVRIGGLVQLTVRLKPAQKKRKGRNPATGEVSRPGFDGDFQTRISVLGRGIDRHGPSEEVPR